jgi:hypothetical protein
MARRIGQTYARPAREVKSSLARKSNVSRPDLAFYDI